LVDIGNILARERSSPEALPEGRTIPLGKGFESEPDGVRLLSVEMTNGVVVEKPRVPITAVVLLKTNVGM